MNAEEFYPRGTIMPRCSGNASRKSHGRGVVSCGIRASKTGKKRGLLAPRGKKCGKTGLFVESLIDKRGRRLYFSSLRFFRFLGG
jgi:hypothetical protein